MVVVGVGVGVAETRMRGVSIREEAKVAWRHRRERSRSAFGIF